MVTKKVLLAMLLIGVFMLNIQAQTMAKDEIQLVVSGDGVNKEEATKTALRSAIEQTYGTFVSANTEVLNDEIVKDEIATVTSGNIKSFECIAENALDGKYFVTLKAIVSIGKLVEYTKSKGATTELAGATFAMNMKIRELNKQNEVIALHNLFAESKKIMPHIFDYEIKLGDPKLSDISKGNYEIEAEIILKSNKNTEELYDLFHNTLSSLSLSETEAEEYKKANLEVNTLNIEGWLTEGRHGGRSLEGKFIDSHSPIYHYYQKYILRNHAISDGNSYHNEVEDFFVNMNNMVAQSILLFKISDNLGVYGFLTEAQGSIEENTNADFSVLRFTVYGAYHEILFRRSDEHRILKYTFRGRNSHLKPDRIENRFYNMTNSPVFFPHKSGDSLYSFKIQLCYTPDELAKITEIKINPLVSN